MSYPHHQCSDCSTYWSDSRCHIQWVQGTSQLLWCSFSDASAVMCVHNGRYTCRNIFFSDCNYVLLLSPPRCTGGDDGKWGNTRVCRNRFRRGRRYGEERGEGQRENGEAFTLDKRDSFLPHSPFLSSSFCPPSLFLSIPPSLDVSLSLQGRVRAITSDEEFEHELKQAGETLVVVDFTADWWVDSRLCWNQ